MRVATSAATCSSFLCSERTTGASKMPQKRSISAYSGHLNVKDHRIKDCVLIDPCQGSGHILVYLFDVLMQIYREDGYSERDAARCILEHNLYGLDIDDRAYQLSYFAVLMKARQYDRMILKKHIQPHVYSIQESNTVNRNQLKYFGADMSVIERNNAMNQLTGLLDTFKDAKEYGSILNVDRCDWDLLRRFTENDRVVGQMDFEAYGIDQTKKQLLTLVEIGQTMAQKYHVVITNPPYMGVSSGNNKLNSFVKKYYPEEKVDLYTVFISRCYQLTRENCFQAMITQHGWMFLGSFENMRKKTINHDIVNMAHLGARAFEEIGGEVVQTTTFVIRNSRLIRYKGIYSRLIDGLSQDAKEKMFLMHNKEFYTSIQEFEKIPGSPIAYWVNEKMVKAFSGHLLGDFAETKQGFATGDNEKFLRLWFETDIQKTAVRLLRRNEAIKSSLKWFPCTKGGSYRKWYGNNSYVANWEDNGREMTNFQGSVIRNPQYYFREGITWSSLANQLSLRYTPEGFLFESKGSMCYTKGDISIRYLLALLNSKVTSMALQILSPTLDFHEGPMSKVPVLIAKNSEEIIEKSNNCIEIAKKDWDSEETSWDFLRHPLIAVISRNHVLFETGKISLAKCFRLWETECNDRFFKLKENEEQLNQFFISAYDLEELSPEVEEKDITVRKADVQRDIKSLISFAVGCMFGRYSLDIEGLAYAGGDWKEAYASKYKTFMPDADAIIPITDEEYFKDDIVARFVDFISVVYGEETLEENLKFIADALGNKGDTPRAVIRNYFLNDFYKDHCNTYSVTGSGKRPIYWLFDSGKQNGFKALIYIHRYTPDTVGLIRSVYLHNAQAAIQNSLQNSEYIISTTTSATERARESRKKDKYVKQLNELRPYYQALSHIALQRISMDLDDGVKKNYQLFQGVEVSTEGKKKQTIDLLAKI